MKNYKVVFSERAKKDLKKLDRHIQSLIVGWIEKNLQNCENPRIHGKALTSNKSRRMEISYWRL